MSVEVARIVNALPYINSGNAEDYLAAVLNHLPSWERASSLCEIYLEHCSWLTRPVKRDQLLNELLPAVYKRNTASLTAGFGTQDDAKRSVHGDEIALLLMIFAIGALGDLTLPACNEDAEEFYQLARAVAVTQTLFENPTLAAVQAIILMASYISLSSRYNALDASSSMVALACSLARSVRFHYTLSRSSKLIGLISVQMGLRELFVVEFETYSISYNLLHCNRPRSSTMEA